VSRRALLIGNPAASRTSGDAVAEVAAVLRSGGWTIEVAATVGPGDARRLAEEAVRDGCDTVVVFGGDGTTMQAASALVGGEVLLGVIPGGTGNLLAGNLRLPASPVRAARALLTARPRAIDLGRMERDDGVHYFAVAAGCGYDALVMGGTSADDKRRWGFLAYVVTTFRMVPYLHSSRHLITVDGVEHEAAATMIVVANCREVIPPYVRFRTGIEPDDGLLDLVVIRADGFLQAVQSIWHLLTERNSSGSLVSHLRGREIRVESERPEGVQLDGELVGSTPFTATIVPHAIRVLAPVRP